MAKYYDARLSGPAGQQGFLQNLIIPALILMGVVLMGWNYTVASLQNGQAIARSVDTTRAQLDQIQKVLNWCRAMYPAGNNGTAFHKNLPGSPAGDAWTPTRTLVCPGDTSGTLWQASREQLSVPGMYLSEWEYRNIAGGVYLRISVQAPGDTTGQSVLTQVSARLTPSQKNLTGDTLEILVNN